MSADSGQSRIQWPDLRGWNLYFLSKLLLAWMGALNLQILPNLLFMAVLLVPVRLPWLRWVRNLAAVPVGVALYYQDTWWPPFSRLLAQRSGLSQFSGSYLLELAQRFVNWHALAIVALLLLAYWLLKPWLRMTTFSVVGMLCMALSTLPMPVFFQAGQGVAAGGSTVPAGGVAGSASGPVNDTVLNEYVTGFFQQQAGLKTTFPAAVAGAAPFDVILLNVCSLAWSDLDMVGMRHNNLFDHMDVIFDEFNSATSYSGPAGIRLLRSSCGQSTHSGLYDPMPQGCGLFANLKALGFDGEWAMNHDGHFENYISLIGNYGGIQAQPMDTAGLPTPLVAFDGSAEHRDGDVLMAWWKRRLSESSRQVVLFYNTTTLHDGTRLTRPDGRSSTDYKPRAQMQFDDMAGFIQAIQASGRRAMVVVIPEHGAALHGDRMQIPGMREIPSPSITRVPVGVKLVNMGVAGTDGPRHVADPTSHLALSELISRVYAQNASATGLDWPRLLKGLPVTPPVSETEGAKVIQYQGKPWLQLKGSNHWTLYPEDNP